MTEPLEDESIGTGDTGMLAWANRFSVWKNTFNDSGTMLGPSDFDAAGDAVAATNLLDSQLGSASRAQLNDINAAIAAAVAAGLAEAKTYADEQIAASGAAAVPTAPTIGTATPGAGQISQAFTLGAANNSTIDQVRVTATSSDGGTLAVFTTTAGTVTSPQVVTGLTPSAHYTVTVAAHNAVGWSAESTASSSVQIDAVAGGSVNRNQLWNAASPINTAITGSETTQDELLFRYGSNTTTLSAAITSSSPASGTPGGNLPVANYTHLPVYYWGLAASVRYTQVLIDSEEILCYVDGGLVKVVTRGYNSTTPADHALGATVKSVRHFYNNDAWRVYFGKSTDPDWELDMPNWTVPTSFNRGRPAQTFTGVKAPSNVAAGTDSDAQTEIIQPDGTYYDMFLTNVNAGTSVISCTGWATGNVVDDPGMGTTGGQNDGTRAANFGIGVGMLSGFDITNGRNSARDATTLTDSGAAWSGNTWETDCFVGYRVRSGLTQGACDIYADITSNTGTVLTFSGGWKKISDNSAASTPPVGGAYWITNTTYTMEHGLVVAVGNGLLDNANNAYVAPATAPDNGQHTGPYKCGQKWIVPSGTSKPSGLSVLGELLWTGIATYGIWIGDYAGTANILVYTEKNTVPVLNDATGLLQPAFVFWGGSAGASVPSNPDAGNQWDGKADLDKIVPLLRLVTG